MADVMLSNIASAQGSYDSVPTAMDSTAVATLLVDGLTIEKSADKQVWVTGPLTYTITIGNTASFPYENPVITDVLDPTLVVLVDGSVSVDGTPTSAYGYDDATGTLTVNLPDIAVGGTAVVTFQVQKA